MLFNQMGRVELARPVCRERVTRRWFILVCAVCALGAFGGRELQAQQPPAAAPSGTHPLWRPWIGAEITVARVPAKDRFGGVVARASDNFWLPVYWGLGADPRLRRAIRLSAQQEKRLREISAAAWKEVRGSDRELATLRQGEVKEFLKNEDKNSEELAVAARRQMEQFLTPSQLAICKKRSVSAVVGNYLYDPKSLDELGVTAGQREELARAVVKLDEEWHRRRYQLYQDFGARLLAVLGRAQQEKLRAAMKREDVAFEPVREAGRLTLPLRDELQEAAARKELGLSQEQEKEIRSILAKYASTSGTREVAESVRRRVEALLTPKQRATLKGIDTRVSVIEVSFTPEMAREIGLTEQQRTLMRTLDQKLRQEMWTLNCEMNDQLLGVFTVAQQQELGAKCDRGAMHAINGSCPLSGTISVPN